MADEGQHEPAGAPDGTSGYAASRRDVLCLGLGAAVAGGAALTGCSGARPAASTTRTTAAGRSRTAPASAAVIAASATPLPSPVPWQAGIGEVHPDVKQLATRVLHTIGSWDAAGGGSVAAAAERLRSLRLPSALNQPNALAVSARPLLGPQGAAVTAVIAAQYGGILASSASVLVVLEQHRRRPDDGILSRGTTVDVRLARDSMGWRVTSLRPAHPGPAAGGLSAAAMGLRASARVRLAVSGRADVAGGLVHDSVCQALLSLSRTNLLDVSVVRSGHPAYVFGTSRPSDHPQGRAVDPWALDGKRVVEPRHRSFVEAALRAASATGARQVGGPVDLDGAGPAYFSDQTHQDHLHLGFHA